MLWSSSILQFLAARTWWESSLSLRNSGRNYSDGLRFQNGSHVAFFWTFVLLVGCLVFVVFLTQEESLPQWNPLLWWQHSSGHKKPQMGPQIWTVSPVSLSNSNEEAHLLRLPPLKLSLIYLTLQLIGLGRNSLHPCSPRPSAALFPSLWCGVWAD